MSVHSLRLLLICFSCFGREPLVPVKGSLNVTANKDISDNFRVWGRSFPVSTFNITVPCAQSQVHKVMPSQFGLEEFDWPDLNPVQSLWDEFETDIRNTSNYLTDRFTISSLL